MNFRNLTGWRFPCPRWKNPESSSEWVTSAGLCSVNISRRHTGLAKSTCCPGHETSFLTGFHLSFHTVPVVSLTLYPPSTHRGSHKCRKNRARMGKLQPPDVTGLMPFPDVKSPSPHTIPPHPSALYTYSHVHAIQLPKEQRRFWLWAACPSAHTEVTFTNKWIQSQWGSVSQRG